MIYLDNAATSFPKPESVLKAVESAMHGTTSLGRSSGEGAEEASRTVYSCREAAAELFGVAGAENIILTMNATHALNIAIKGMLGNGGLALISGYEHNAVTRPLYALKDKGVRIRIVTAPLFDNDAFLYNFKNALTERPTCAILTCASNVYGWILPFNEAAMLCRRYSVPLILDASQAAGHIPVKIACGADFIAAAGHKGLFGPGGTGILALSGRYLPPTLIEGGTGSDSRSEEMPELPPERYEAGTANIWGAAGLRAGIEYVKKTTLSRLLNHERELTHYAREELSRIKGVRCLACRYPERQTGVLSFTIEGIDSEYAAESFSEKGIALRGGLHCAPLAHDSAGDSHGSIRMSPSYFNTKKDIEALTAAAREIASQSS